MATGWVKSLQCKSNALEDVYPLKRSASAAAKSPPAPSFSCRSSSQALRDAVFLIPHILPPLPKKSQSFPSSSSSPAQISQPNRSQTQPETTKLTSKDRRRPRPKPKPKPSTIASPAPLPTLTSIPQNHSSRRVVEIIFGSSWSSRGAPFPGEIEMLFRFYHPPNAVACFEDFRASVRSRADDPRCAADGNEMMRFRSAASIAGGGEIYDAGVTRCAVGKLKGVRTFAGSCGAHESTGGGGGRRAMLVCRVIAGRVRDASDPYLEADSVCLGKGELLVFDPSAVLPCFLIIYKV